MFKNLTNILSEKYFSRSKKPSQVIKIPGEDDFIIPAGEETKKWISMANLNIAQHRPELTVIKDQQLQHIEEEEDRLPIITVKFSAFYDGVGFNAHEKVRIKMALEEAKRYAQLLLNAAKAGKFGLDGDGSYDMIIYTDSHLGELIADIRDVHFILTDPTLFIEFIDKRDTDSSGKNILIKAENEVRKRELAGTAGYHPDDHSWIDSYIRTQDTLRTKISLSYSLLVNDEFLHFSKLTSERALYIYQYFISERYRSWRYSKQCAYLFRKIGLDVCNGLIDKTMPFCRFYNNFDDTDSIYTPESSYESELSAE